MGTDLSVLGVRTAVIKSKTRSTAFRWTETVRPLRPLIKNGRTKDVSGKNKRAIRKLLVRVSR